MKTRTTPVRIAIFACMALFAALIGGLTLAEPADLLAVPGIPQNVDASHDQADYIEVSWDAVPEATGYQVLRATSEYGTYAVVNADAIVASPWRDLWALSGQGYWYKVRACSLAGCGQRSDPASGYRNGPPLPPTNVLATDGVTTNTITITWTISLDTIDYAVLRNTVNDPETAWQMARVSSPPYADHFPVAHTTYWYWVTARNAHGDSRYSLPDRGYCGDEPPDWNDITPTPTRTSTRYATATDGPPPSLTPTPSTTPTSGLPTATPGAETATATVTPDVFTPTSTITSTPTATRTSGPLDAARIALPIVLR